MDRVVCASSFTAKEYVKIGIFTALITVGAFIRVPVPVCPFTLQFLFTTLAGLVLGRRCGAMAVLAYVVLGLLGVPVFTAGGGPSYVFQPTFGYLIGFIIGAWVTGAWRERYGAASLKRLLAGNILNLVVVYALGMAYVYAINTFYLGTPIGLWPLVLYCFILAIPGDLCICIVSALFYRRVARHISV